MHKLGYLRRLRSHAVRVMPTAAFVIVAAIAGRAGANFITFESGQVRPLALSPDGTKLFAVNTPDDRLEIFTVDASGDLAHSGSVPVGLEPVAVAVRADGTQAWVVNTLSDSVSIVDLTAPTPHVIRTLLEPNIDTVLRTPGIGRADVWVFDANDLGPTLEGVPMTIITLFTDTPR